MPKLDIGDAEIYYEEKGSGPPLLLVPGLGGGGAWWHHQVEGRCHVNRHLASLWAPTPEIMQRSSLAATVSSRRRGIGGVFGGRPDGVGR